MESLIASALLWKNGLGTYDEYNKILDERFLENPDNDILLELEWCSSDCEKTFSIINNFRHYEYFQKFNVDRFGEKLFCGLEAVYMADSIPIDEFGRRCYQLWNCLPAEIDQIEPFWTLGYADDYLSYGDEEQCRKSYERAFSHYKL